VIKDYFLSLVGQENHDQRDCFGAAILSHGTCNGFWAFDKLMPIETFVAPIKNSSSLSGKPKLFFFQVEIKNN